LATILPLVSKYKAEIVGLCMDDSGMPETAVDRLKIADKLIHDMVSAGVLPLGMEINS